MARKRAKSVEVSYLRSGQPPMGFVAQSELASIVEPVADPAPVLEPEPAPVLEPEPAPVLEPEPAPVLEPEPAPAVETEPAPVLEPEPAPVLDPEPAAVLEPEPAPVLESEPAAVLDPEPELPVELVLADERLCLVRDLTYGMRPRPDTWWGDPSTAGVVMLVVGVDRCNALVDAYFTTHRIQLELIVPTALFSLGELKPLIRDVRELRGSAVLLVKEESETVPNYEDLKSFQRVSDFSPLHSLEDKLRLPRSFRNGYAWDAGARTWAPKLGSVWHYTNLTVRVLSIEGAVNPTPQHWRHYTDSTVRVLSIDIDRDLMQYAIEVVGPAGTTSSKFRILLNDFYRLATFVADEQFDEPDKATATPAIPAPESVDTSSAVDELAAELGLARDEIERTQESVTRWVAQALRGQSFAISSPTIQAMMARISQFSGMASSWFNGLLQPLIEDSLGGLRDELRELEKYVNELEARLTNREDTLGTEPASAEERTLEVFPNHEESRPKPVRGAPRRAKASKRGVGRPRTSFAEKVFGRRALATRDPRLVKLVNSVPEKHQKRFLYTARKRGGLPNVQLFGWSSRDAAYFVQAWLDQAKKGRK